MSASVVVKCDHCGASYRVPNERLGRELRCSKCQSVFRLGGLATTPHLKEKPARSKPPVAASPTNHRPVGSLLKSPTDRFEILAELGAGAFGTVYKARDRQLDRLVALKVPKLGVLGSAADSERFLREARSAGN